MKTTSPVEEESAFSTSPSTRRTTLMWSTPNAVPQVATAVVIACEMTGHHIRVPLDDDDLLAAGDVAPREVESVEHLALW